MTHWVTCIGVSRIETTTAMSLIQSFLAEIIIIIAIFLVLTANIMLIKT